MSETRSKHPALPDMAVLVIGAEGQVVSASAGARTLLGHRSAATCREFFRWAPGARDLPCTPDCAAALLRGRAGAPRKTAIGLAGARYELACVSAEGRAVCVLRRLADHSPAPPWQALTPRERDVLALCAQGLTTAAIGESLGISSGTVRTHVEHMLGKLEVPTRAALVAKAAALGHFASPESAPQ